MDEVLTEITVKKNNNKKTGMFNTYSKGLPQVVPEVQQNEATMFLQLVVRKFLLCVFKRASQQTTFTL